MDKFIIFSLLIVACFSSKGQHFEWVEQVGLNGGGNDYTLDALEDSHGNIYTSGMAKNNVTVGTGVNQVTLAGFGDQDLLICKYKSDATLKWVKRFGSGLTEQGAAIEIDEADNIYVSGLFQTSFTMGSYSLTALGSNNGYISKLDSAGNVLWALDWGHSSSSTLVHDIKLDSLGHIYILGSFNNQTIIGNDTLNAVGSSDIYLTKLDTSGQFVWSKRYGGAGFADGSRMMLMDNSKLLISGRFKTAISFGAVSLSGSTNYNGWIACMDSSGTALWADGLVGTTGARFGGIGLNDSTIIVNGNFRDVCYVQSDSSASVTSSGSADVCILKYDLSGNLIWINSFGGASSADRGFDIIISKDRIFGHMSIDDNTVLDGNSVPIIGTDDDIIFELDNNGGLVNWYQLPGYPASGISPFISRLNIMSCSRILVCGAFMNTVDFTPQVLSAHFSAADGFVGVMRPRVGNVHMHVEQCMGDTTIYSFADSCRLDSMIIQLVGSDTIVSEGFSHILNSPNGAVYDAIVITNDGYYTDTIFIDSAWLIHAPPLINLQDTGKYCPNDSVLVTVNPGLGNYSWSSGETVNSTYFNQSGIEWLEVIDSNGCLSKDTINIVGHFVIMPSLGQDTTLCLGDSLTLEPGNFIDYLWSNGSTQNSIDAAFSGMYAVSVIDSNGCELADSIVITFETCEGIINIALESLDLYPNPSYGNIVLQNISLDNAMIAVFSTNGNLVYKSILTTNQVDLSFLSAGMYNVVVHSDGTSIKSKRLVIAK